MKTLLFLPLLLLAACSPQATPPPRAIIVPKASARVDLAPVIASATKVAARSENAAEHAGQTGDAIARADAAVAKAQASKPGDLKAFLAEARRQLGIAGVENQSSKRAAADAGVIAAELGRQLAEKNAALADRDRELAQYRQALPQANATINDDAKVIEKIPGLIADKARNAVYRHWVLALVGGVTFLTIAAAVIWILIRAGKIALRPP